MDAMAFLVDRVCLASKATKAARANCARPGSKAKRVSQDFLDNRASLVTAVCLAFAVILDRQDLRVSLARLAGLDRWVHLAEMDHQE